ncbi:MAG TPA: transposase [Ignavibacteriaceae bacterium]
MSKTDLSLYFAKPSTPDHKKYEVLRALFFEKLHKNEVIEKFGYTEYTLQAIIRDFKQGKLIFFLPKKPGPKDRTTPEEIRTKIVSLRKQNLSSEDICNQLLSEDIKVGKKTIERILEDEGFTKLPRRTNQERGLTKKKSIIPERACQLESCELKNQKFHCKTGGIFLFIPYLLKINLPDIIHNSHFPETSEISKLNYVLSILSLKLIGQERLSQINDFSLDRGLGLFAGLNVLPKSTAISTYSYSIDKEAITLFQEAFVKNLNEIDESYYSGETINLDFHTIPHFGDNPPLDNHWSGSRNKAMKSAYTFIAQDAESRMTSYINADIRKGEESQEILHFVDYWVSIKGIVKETLVFDSRLTNYDVLEKFGDSNIKFITLRRRGSNLVENAFSLPAENWKEIKLDIPKRKYNKFKVFEHVTTLTKGGHPVREIIIKDHGREEPTFLVTNNFDFPIETCVELYARRWRIENKIAELVKFFSLNALSSPIAIRIFMDVMLTMVADICYRLFARDIYKFEDATPQTIFSKFIDVTGNVEIVDNEIIVQLRKNAQAPILISNPIFKKSYEIPWLNNIKLKYVWI